jgi:tetrahydromethanopterin S-methyltransferase subunit B
MDDLDHHNDAILARIDERVRQLGHATDRLEKMLEDYVTRLEFLPVRAIAYGLAALILTAVATAIIANVIHR